jgi:chromate transporter
MTVPLHRLVLYFLELGAIGFGGPIALCGFMQRDLVEREGWLTREDYLDGLALAQLAPGPLAAQLAIYIGWRRAGVWGATAVGVAFVLPSLVMVIVLAHLYVRYAAVSTMIAGLFYGIGAAVIAVIVRSAYKLVRLTLASDAALWIVFTANAIVTAITEQEVVTVILVSGVLVVLARWRGSVPPAMLLALPASTDLLLQIGWFFTKAGAFVFGSGLAIVPFLYGGVVERFHWLSDRQFLDAVAVAMITPGPVVITVAFIGYLVGGLGGALVAAFAVFLPCWFAVVAIAPFYQRLAANERIRAFVDGVSAAATGAIAGAAFVLGRRALIDPVTIAICIVVFVVLMRFRKVPEPAVILAAGSVGMLLK